jgi:hypothetical protein
VAALDKEIRRFVRDDLTLRRFMTVPGVGPVKPTPERTVTPAKASVSRMLDFEMPIREQPRWEADIPAPFDYRK